MATKFIFVTGGVVSSLGKGITASSLGRLLKSRGLKVSMQKFDPYINLNPGMMSPLQHGEVFVTDDGGECDLDLGHYERFIDENLTVDSDITSGQIYQSVINKERQGDYHGGTVQVIPHITNEIKRSIFRVARTTGCDVVITEVGGTVGDIESQPFLEAIRQIKWEVGMENCLFIHVTLVPYLGKAQELKTKPTQHSVKELRSIGIQPDIIVCRCELEGALTQSLRDKIGLFCNVEGASVIPNYDAETLYDVPLMMHKEGLDELVCKKLCLDLPAADLEEWNDLVYRFKHLERRVRIALVGKYVDLHDAYISVYEALVHAGITHSTEVDIDWVYSGDLTDLASAEKALSGADGILVPGGFGERGMEGMVFAAQYAREHNVPYFGLGLGLQMAVVEFARNVCGLDADTTERTPNTPHPVIDLMEEYKSADPRADGTMRLGGYACELAEGSIARAAYQSASVIERHRNRYEINPRYVPSLEEKGLVVTGVCPTNRLPEMVELNGHRWFVGISAHAEFTSRPNRPHPLFVAFLGAALSR